jgi:hypothetical protein
MEEHFSWAAEYADKVNRHLQQQSLAAGDKKQAPPAERPVQQAEHEQPTEQKNENSPPEKSQADWRRSLQRPDNNRRVEDQEQGVKERPPDRTQETPQRARSTGDDPDKRADNRDVDWRRSLTDPDYRRQVRAEERTQQLERSGVQEQGRTERPSGREQR